MATRNCSRKAGSVETRVSSAASAAASPTGKVAGQSMPRSPRLPGIREAITGVPAAIASDTTLAPPSMRELMTIARERAISCRARAGVTSPSQR